MKRANKIISVMLAGILIISMSGCGKKNTFQGGEGTNFPYTWKEERKGTILLTLDGTYGPEDYHWDVASTDEDILQVKVVKAEKKGKITYRITPLGEGAAQITFIRQREVAPMVQIAELPGKSENIDITEGTEGTAGTENTANTESDDGLGEEEFVNYSDPTESHETDPGDIREDQTGIDEIQVKEESVEDEGSEEASDTAAVVARVYENYLDQYCPKDAIAEIVMHFNSDPTGKKGKCKLHVAVAATKEHQGIMKNMASTEDGQDFDYCLWEDASGLLQLQLPYLESAWSVDWQSEYTPSEEEEIPGILTAVPEKEDGKYVIMRIKDAGYVEGVHCYTIQGLDQGSATLKFSNPKAKKSLTIQVDISKNGEISVVTHGLSDS